MQIGGFVSWKIASEIHVVSFVFLVLQQAQMASKLKQINFQKIFN